MPTIIKSDPKAREKPCLRCGYSLRKLTDSTHCPECGLSVWLSLNQNDTLEMSNPEWLRTMAKGAMVMIVGLAVALCAYLFFAAYELPQMGYQLRVQQAFDRAHYDPNAYDDIQNMGPPPVPRVSYLRNAIFCSMAYLALYHAGLFLLASNENRHPDRLRDWKMAARVTCGAAGVVMLMMAAWAVSPLSLGLFGIALKLLVVASMLVTWGLIRNIARRAPQPVLAKICTWLMFLPLISLLKIIPSVVFLLMHFAWLIDLLPIVYVPTAVGLLAWAAWIFVRAARSAEKNWCAETAITR